jgi:sulfur carrier protein
MNAPAATVAISVNGEARALAQGMSLSTLLAELGLAPDAVATAVNGLFIARALRADCLLSNGDRVTCFKPITGG